MSILFDSGVACQTQLHTESNALSAAAHSKEGSWMHERSSCAGVGAVLELNTTTIYDWSSVTFGAQGRPGSRRARADGFARSKTARPSTRLGRRNCG
eukprot:3487175-Pleurochrysis_carterae.AAC.1